MSRITVQFGVFLAPSLTCGFGSLNTDDGFPTCRNCLLALCVPGERAGDAPGARFGDPPVGLRQVGVVLGGLLPPPNRLLMLLPRLSLRGFSFSAGGGIEPAEVTMSAVAASAGEGDPAPLRTMGFQGGVDMSHAGT